MDIYIVDSDNMHAARLRNLCRTFFFRRERDALVTSCTDIEELTECLEENNLLSLFLLSYGDMQKSTVQEIRKKNIQNYIVLLVQDLKEMLKGVNPDTRPSGCLMKPVEEEAVAEVLEEVWEDYEQIEKDEERFLFKIQSAEYTLACRNILFFESSSKKILVRTENQEFSFYDSMEKVLTRLPERFMRIHKSFIVNTDMIRKIDFPGMMVYLNDDSFLLLSRTYKNALLEWMKRKEGEGIK